MHQKTLAASYYLDWYALNNEHPVFVTYVRSIERYFKWLLILIVLFVCISQLLVGVVDDQRQLIKQTEEVLIQEIYINNDGSMGRKELNKLTEIERELTDNEIEHIVVISNLIDSNTAKEQYDRLLALIKTYNNSATIYEVKEKKLSIPTNTVIIQLIKGD